MDYFNELGEIASQNNRIENKFYHLYKVKRGLRNADGSGVLVGLTTVSKVLGFEKIDEEIIPIDGQLVYRGYSVYDIVKHFSQNNQFGFDAVTYLLLFGKFPTKEELAIFSETLGKMRVLPKNFARDVLQTFRTPDIMNALSRSVLTLYGSDEKADDLSGPNQIRQAMELIAKINSLVPYAYYSIQHGFFDKSLIIHKTDPTLSAAQNFLHLIRPTSEYSDLEAKTLDIALILHAEHGGGNNSTFTTRVVSSTNTDFYSAIAAGLGSLRGPLHGGANVRVANMMEDLKRNVKNPHSGTELHDYLLSMLQGKVFDGAGKIYGVGHAVYTQSDPRAEILRKYAERLAKEKGREEEFDVYRQVEKLAPDVLREHKNNPDMFVSSNVDFYSGFVYDCLGIPKEVYTPLFAVARVVGWCAHRVELMTNPGKIMRPAYKALGKGRDLSETTEEE